MTVHTIDCNYVHPRVACAYLIVEGDRAAFVENNTTHAVPALLAALQDHGLSPESVDYAIITHVHLDHAGGTSALVDACPNATVLAHPKAGRHVINPTRLIESSKQVYGEELFLKLYGEIRPVDESRVRMMDDGEQLKFGTRTLTFLHTRGHADHHFCVHDSSTNGIFTGDSFGIGYPDLQSGSSPFLYPSSTPTQFDPDLARQSVDRILGTGAELAYLTHFGPFYHMQEGAQQLKRGLDVFEEMLEQACTSNVAGDELQVDLEAKMKDYMLTELGRRGISPGKEESNLLAMDININAMGIAHLAERRRRAS